MKNILNNKFILIFLLTIVTIFSFVSNVFAVTNFSVDDNSFNLPNWFNNYNYFYFVRDMGDGDYTISFILSSDDLYINDNKMCATGNCYSLIAYHFNSSTDLSSCFDESEFRDVGSTGTYITFNYNFNCYTNQNIYDVNDNLVFQGAPQVTEITKALAEQARQANPLTQIKTIIPIVIVVIVSLIALYKALRLLFQTLGKA